MAKVKHLPRHEPYEFIETYFPIPILINLADKFLNI